MTLNVGQTSHSYDFGVCLVAFVFVRQCKGGKVKRGLSVLLLVTGLMLLFPTLAYAVSDDDIPGAPVAVGGAVNGVVDTATDPVDVYSVVLVSGQQVEIKTTIPNASAPDVAAALLAPGAVNIAHASSVASGDTWGDGICDIIYTPARDGTYYISLTARGHGCTYSLSIVRTNAAPITTPDSDDIFGLAIGTGSLSGVVDETVDPNDVYAVKLFASEQVRIRTTIPNASAPDVAAALLAPGAVNIAHASSVASGDTWGDGVCDIVYTPARDGVYFIWISTDRNNGVYGLSISGSAEKPAYPCSLRLRSSTALVRRGKNVRLTATLVDTNSNLIPGQTAALLRSYDNHHWKVIKSINSTTGRYSATVRISRKTWFRTSFAGSSEFSKCISRKVLVGLRRN